MSASPFPDRPTGPGRTAPATVTVTGAAGQTGYATVFRAAADALVGEVDGVAVWANHSASQYPDLTHATVGGRPALEVLAERDLGLEWVDSTFIPRVARRGAEIIDVRGGSSVASAAHAALCHVRDWVLGTPGAAWTSMGVPSDGSYGVPEGLVSSFPVTCRDGRARIVPGLELDRFSGSRIEASVRELEEERTAVQQLGLLRPRR